MGQRHGDWQPYNCCNRTSGMTVVENLYCVDNTFFTTFEEASIDEETTYLEKCTGKMDIDISWISPGKGIQVQCVQICCGNDEPYSLYPTRLTLRSNSTVKLQQAIDYIKLHHLHVNGARTDDYERLYYEEYKESSSLTTIEGYFAAFVGFAVLVATCVHFQNESQTENKRNAQMTKEVYNDPNGVAKEMSLLASFALQRHSSPNHAQNPIGRSNFHLFKEKQKYNKLISRGTMLGLGRAHLDDDSSFMSTSEEEEDYEEVDDDGSANWNSTKTFE